MALTDHARQVLGTEEAVTARDCVKACRVSDRKKVIPGRFPLIVDLEFGIRRPGRITRRASIQIVVRIIRVAVLAGCDLPVDVAEVDGKLCFCAQPACRLARGGRRTYVWRPVQTVNHRVLVARSSANPGTGVRSVEAKRVLLVLLAANRKEGDGCLQSRTASVFVHTLALMNLPAW